MLEHRKLEHLAHLSVARGSGFAMLAIATVMVGLSGNMAAALEAGGVLALLGCMVLLIKAGYALRRHYRDTELWIMLEPEERPSKAVAQRIIGTVLRQMYLTFARHFALGSVALLAGSLVLGLLGSPHDLARAPFEDGAVASATRAPGLSPAETRPFRTIP